MPTFILYKVQRKLDKISGANPNGLKELIEKHYQADEDDDVQVKGYVSKYFQNNIFSNVITSSG